MEKEALIYMCIQMVILLYRMLQNGKITEETFQKNVKLKIRFLEEFGGQIDSVKDILSTYRSNT